MPGIAGEAVRLRTDEAVGGQVQVRLTATGDQPFTVVSVALGMLLGGIAGFFRGWIDTLIMRLVEVLSAQGQLIADRAELPVLEQGLAEGRAMLAVLLGVSPA